MIYLNEFDPVAFSLGPFAVRWYGLMYAVGFTAAWFLGRGRVRRGWGGWSEREMDDLLVWMILGLLIGARVGYTLFYNPVYFLGHPLEFLAVWKGGMSFHGGMLGMLAAAWLFKRKHGRTILEIGDFMAPLAPPGLMAGRIGNFINMELHGTPTTLPWAVVYPPDSGIFGPRHPSQLYESLLEGLVLFAVVWIFSMKPRPRGRVLGLFLLLYGIFRSMAELFREPDPQLGYLLFNQITMGQILCLPMIAVGGWLLVRKARAQGR